MSRRVSKYSKHRHSSSDSRIVGVNTPYVLNVFVFGPILVLGIVLAIVKMF